MARTAVTALKDSLENVIHYEKKRAKNIRRAEDETDHWEDVMGTYLLKLTSRNLSEEESARATEYMKLIGDYERIADHAVNIVESSEEMKSKNVMFSENAAHEYSMISQAVAEILDLPFQAFSKDDFYSARKTEPLEQVIDQLKEDLRTRHLIRLQNRECSVASGFIRSDLLTNLERVADHCSNISGCVLDMAGRNMNIHENQRIIRDSKEDYRQQYQIYLAKYCS